MTYKAKLLQELISRNQDCSLKITVYMHTTYPYVLYDMCSKISKPTVCIYFDLEKKEGGVNWVEPREVRL